MVRIGCEVEFTEEFRKDRYIFSNKPGVIDVSEKSKKAREFKQIQKILIKNF